MLPDLRREDIAGSGLLSLHGASGAGRRGGPGPAVSGSASGLLLPIVPNHTGLITPAEDHPEYYILGTELTWRGPGAERLVTVNYRPTRVNATSGCRSRTSATASGSFKTCSVMPPTTGGGQ
jgi:hypothetical protein